MQSMKLLTDLHTCRDLCTKTFMVITKQKLFGNNFFQSSNNISQEHVLSETSLKTIWSN